MKFNTKKTIAYWYESAKYDLATAGSLFKVSRYPYALFFGHLALEKLLKALVVKYTKKHAPYTHSLPFLASKLTFKMPEKMTSQLALFMEFYLQARYPEEQKKFYKKCTEDFTRLNLREIKRIFKWLKQRL